MAPDVSAAPAGSWATFNHDFQRTGRADGTASMANPKVAWSLPMGGLLGTQQALVADLTGDGNRETLTVSGGRVTAHKANGSSLWATGLVSPTALLGVWDLNGDGTPEVVADAIVGALILSGTDGHLLTTLPSSVPLQAVFAKETTGGILILSGSYGPVSGFDFRNGTSVTSPLWSISNVSNEGFQASELTGDVDGDSIPDLVRPRDTGFEVDDPLTGLVKYSIALTTSGSPAYYYDYQLADVDGSAGSEIIAVDPSYQYSPGCGIYVLSVKGGALTTLWSSTASPSLALGADYFMAADSLASVLAVDGGSALQLVYSKWNGSTWTTIVADAGSGAALGTIPGGFLQGVGDVDGDGRAEIVTRSSVLGDQSPPRSTVSVYDLDSLQTGPVAKAWTLASAHVLTTAPVQLPAPGLSNLILSDFDPSTPGLEILAGVDGAYANADTKVVVVHGNDGSVASTYSIPTTVSETVVAIGDRVTSSTSANDVVVAENDGTLHLLDHTLVDRAKYTAGTYLNWITGIATDDGFSNLFMATSNGHMKWIDGRRLRSDGSPYVRYDEAAVVVSEGYATQGYPLDPVAYLGGMNPALITVESTSTHENVVAHGPSGVASWSLALDQGARVDVPGVYAIDLNGDGNDDLVMNIVGANGVGSLNGYDGIDGALLQSVLVGSLVSGTDELLAGALVDVNGDSHPDLVVPQHNNTPGASGVVAIDLFGQPFVELWDTARPDAGADIAQNGTVGVLPTGDGGIPAVIRTNGNNGYGPYQRIDFAGNIGASSNDGLPVRLGLEHNAGVFVSGSSPATSDLVVAGSADLALSRLRRINGNTMSVVWTMYASNGTVGSAIPSQLYALHDPIVMDVNGDGTDDVVFGSDDGYLYAVRSTDGSLVFAMNLDAPVAHLIASNIDSDPALEIVASLSDGRLVAIDQDGAYKAVQDVPDAGTDSSVDAGSDASTADSGGSETGPGDASAEAGLDGGAEAGEASGGGGGGCGCTEAGAGGSSAMGFLAVLGMALGLGLRGRRR